MPTINLGRVQPILRGAYDTLSTYEVLDFVTHNGSTYGAKQNVPAGNAPPDANYWQLMAQGATPAEILNALKSVDGEGSGLDADLFRGLEPSDFIPATSAAALLDRSNHTGQQPISSVEGLEDALQGAYYAFNKSNRDSRLFVISGTDLITDQPVSIDVGGVIFVVPESTIVTLPTLASHTDYLIYCSQSGALSAQPWDDAAPTNSRAIGGFHAYHTTATVNPNSIWDLGYRPTANPRGMTQCPTGDWVDIYLMDVDYGINGYSRGGVTIADGASPPKIPAIYGGNGSTTYGSLTWFEAVDLASAAGKRLLTYAMFTAAAFGVVERQAVGTDPVTTKYQAGHRSACGMEQATGCLWQWGEDINGTSATGTPSWQDIADGRGDVYTHSIRAVLLGASWNNASNSGSRASFWSSAPSSSGSDFSARASCGHMTL